jgi:transcriptional regulator with XRE-family HTH domain
MVAFKDRLRALRQTLGLSQAQLAERCGLSVDSIQNWEGKRASEPRLSQLAKLAQGLGVSLDTLAGLPAPKHPRRTKSS